MSTAPPFLNVTRSVTGRRWETRAYDERVAEALRQRFDVPDVLARGMAARGVTLDAAADYLDPSLRAQLPNPSLFKDMDKATARVATAIQSGAAITVFGDYDVDGGTSSALLLRFLRACGSAPRLYIPDRIQEGYGPNAVAMERIAATGTKLLICVDCGTTAHEPLRRAHALDMDVIVLDHHAAEPELPPVYALINANRLDENIPYRQLCAAGVTFLFIVAVNRALRAAGFFTAARPEPDLRQWLDLVALGTVADVVPLTGLNRAFVTQGLRVMAHMGNAGLAALMRVGRAGMPPDTFTAGFVLGPRVNAGGRVGQSDLGARLLSCDDPQEAEALAIQLDALNASRKDIEAEVLAAAEYQALQQDGSALLLVAGEGWHPGVIGIVAARLKERYHRPTIVVALDGDVGKGSGRSVRGLDLGAMVIAARQAGLLINGGGHAMAAGLTVAREQVEHLRDFLNQRTARFLEETPLTPTLVLDGMLAGIGMTPEFVAGLNRLKPFGTGNPEPRFVVPSCRIVRADVVGEKHVRVIIDSAGTRVIGIAFRAMDNPLGKELLKPEGRNFHLAGYIRPDNWNGRNGVQLQIEDAAAA
ncbi:MAG: single-stranded-DNA-specific exonuclease RecJ [Alphaproteobacteria bacterium]